MGLFFFLILLAHATYFKRPLSSRHCGLPFVVTRASFLFIDKYYSLISKLQQQVVGISYIRLYLQRLD